MGDVNQLITYGGDPRIVATRAEIERVQHNLAAVGALIGGELDFWDFANQPLRRVGLAMQWPAIDSRLRHLLVACEHAANEYFDGEALVAKEIMDMNLAPAVAGALVGLGAPALLQSRGASARLISSETGVAAPQSFGDLAGRLEKLNAAGRPIVRIESFDGIYLVFLPGTQVWSPIAGKNPLDLTSDLAAMVAPAKADFEKAAYAAIKQAGIGSSDRVILVGHSQGGMIAANIAVDQSQREPGRQPACRVAGVVTFGAPLGQLADKLKVPVIAFAHNNDLVPKLGVKANPLAENWVTVARDSPLQGQNAAPVEAHSISNYKKTAELADSSTDLGLNRVREQILGGDLALTSKKSEVMEFELARN